MLICECLLQSDIMLVGGNTVVSKTDTVPGLTLEREADIDQMMP